MARRGNVSTVVVSYLVIPSGSYEGECLGSDYWFESDLLFPEFLASNNCFLPPPTSQTVYCFQNFAFRRLSNLARLHYPHSRLVPLSKFTLLLGLGFRFIISLYITILISCSFYSNKFGIFFMGL